MIMPVIDSLEVQIQAKAEAVSISLNNVIKQLGLVAEGISAIGRNSGLQEFAKKAQEAVKEFGSIQNAAKNISSNVEPQIQKVSKSLEELTAKYRDLGKGFKFTGSTAAIKKQIDSYSNSLEKAKLKKEELEASGKTEGQMYEYAVRDVLKYENILGSLKNQLEEIQNNPVRTDIIIHGFEEAERNLDYFKEQLSTFKSMVNTELSAGGIEFPVSGIRIALDQLKEKFPEATELISSYEQLSKRVSELSSRVPFQSYNNIDLSSVSNVIDTTQAKIEELQEKFRDVGKDFTFTGNAEQLEAEINKVSAELDKLFSRQDRMVELGKIDSSSFRDLQYNIAEATNKLDILRESRPDALNRSFSESINRTNEFRVSLSQLQLPEIREDNLDKLQKMLEKAEAKLDELRTKMQNDITMGRINANIDDSGYQKIQEQIAMTEMQIQALQDRIQETSHLSGFERFRQILSSIPSAGARLIDVFSEISSSLKKISSLARKAGSVLLKITGLSGAFSKLSSRIAKTSKQSKGFDESLKKGFWSILRYGLGIRSTYTLLNKIRRAIKEGFENLVQFSDEVNGAVSSLTSSLKVLKNAFAAGFSPIVTTVSPYITEFINRMTDALNMLGRFFAALTGKSVAVQAKRFYEDYAASLSDVKDSAEDTKKALDILGFDEVYKLTDTTTSDQDKGNGKTETPISDMFENVSVESSISQFTEKVKAAWRMADFTEIGTIFSKKIGNALNNIDWNKIKGNAEKVGKSIGTFINGFVEIPDTAKSIGQTVGEAINTGISGANSFYDNTKWNEVGTFIGQGLNSILDSIEWDNLGHLLAMRLNAVFETIGEMARTFNWSGFGRNLSESLNTFILDFDWAENGALLGDLAKGLLDSILEFLENTDWQALGNGVANFIGGIDWSGLLERLAEGIGAALGGIGSFIWGVIEEAWNEVVNWWYDTAFEDGQFTMSGLLNGIWEGIKNIGSWIYDHIFKPFVDGFKNAFGIHSPSTVMAEQGGYIISGLLSGLKDNISSVLDWLGNIPRWFKEKFDKACEYAKNAFNGIGNFFGNIWSGIKNAFGDVAGWFKNVFTDAWQGVKNVFSTGGKIFDGIKDGITSVFKTVVNGLIGGFNKVIAFPFNKINGMLNSIRDISILGIEPFKGLWERNPLSVPQIPKLAKGAVIKGGNPFMAILGDQPRGQTNIEAPLDTIRQAVKMELDNVGGYGGYGEDYLQQIEEATYRGMTRAIQAAGGIKAEATFRVENDKDSIFKITQEKAKDYLIQTGKDAYVF